MRAASNMLKCISAKEALSPPKTQRFAFQTYPSFSTTCSRFACSNSSRLLPHGFALKPEVMGAFSSTAKRYFMQKSKPMSAVETFILPDIGEGVASVVILKWYKKEGEEVEEMEPICNVQSDKAPEDISSQWSGKVAKLHFKVGDEVHIGQPLFDINSTDADD